MPLRLVIVEGESTFRVCVPLFGLGKLSRDMVWDDMNYHRTIRCISSGFATSTT